MSEYENYGINREITNSPFLCLIYDQCGVNGRAERRLKKSDLMADLSTDKR